MKSTTNSMNGVKPPFRLPTDTVFFPDWRYVDGGLLTWRDNDNKFLPLWPAPDLLPAVHANMEWVPRGIRIEAMPCSFDDEPVLRAGDMRELVLMNGSVVYEEGVYRLFYGSFDSDTFSNPDKKVMAGFTQSVRYAESMDGLNWSFPDLGRKDGAHPLANVVMKPRHYWHGGSVWKDEGAAAEERYKAFFLGCLDEPEYAAYLEKYPGDVDPMAVIEGDDARLQYMKAYGLFGAVSPDGLNWTEIDEPLIVQHSDTFQACTYDAASRRYVAYLRSWFYGKRSVAIATSEDYRHFSGLRQLHWPGADSEPYDTWYTPGYTTMPGHPEYEMMFVTCWSQNDDQFTPYLYASPDGQAWNRVPGEVLPPQEQRPAWIRCGYAFNTLVPLPGNRVGSLVGGWHVPHKFPREIPFGQLGWVWWQKDRVTALRADLDGQFSLYSLVASGNKVVLNYRTRPSGYIRVQVNGVEGRTLADCDILSGDETHRVVTWKGSSDTGVTSSEPIQLKFEMQNADLFSVRFE